MWTVKGLSSFWKHDKQMLVVADNQDYSDIQNLTPSWIWTPQLKVILLKNKVHVLVNLNTSLRYLHFFLCFLFTTVFI